MIATARRRLGWTQADLAHVLGVECGTVADIERGKYRPSRATVERLRVALKPHLDEWEPETRERGRPRRMEA